jgi:protocatechuate 3,4-dioxygenase beta subunit
MSNTNRRSFIKNTLAGVATSLFASRLYALSTTPSEIRGPFYPVLRQKDKDFDLTKIDGRNGIAKGKIIYLQGRILDSNGQPIENAAIDIWQANAAGRYSHPHDSNPAPLDDNFQGWAILHSRHEGTFNFKTVMPGAYPSGGSWLRPPHIHFKVTSEGHRELITQMYFPGNKLNDSDLLLRRKSRKARSLMTATKIKDDPETYEYNVVLRPG